MRINVVLGTMFVFLFLALPVRAESPYETLPSQVDVDGSGEIDILNDEMNIVVSLGFSCWADRKAVKEK